MQERKRYLLCTVPGCGKKFTMTQYSDFERHVRQCAGRHEDRMDEIVAHRESNYFSAPADPELYGHFRRGGN